MANKLVLVESPAKARTVGQMLGKGYTVKATLGHVRDLPSSTLGVDVEKDFLPKYIVPTEKRKVVKEIKEAAAKGGLVFLATDPDREGEAISWHLVEAAGLRKYQRVAFHEITREAVLQAFEHPRPLDMKLVEAQQARRILDRLVGYKLSPLLWTKFRLGLSAGRVQSAALRMVVDREREIEAFVPQEYWTVEVDLEKSDHPPFRALLVSLADGTKLEISQGTQAEALARDLAGSRYQVQGVHHREVPRHPPPPFITSTLQQDAYRKLGFPAEHTMRLAQQLYEGLDIGSRGRVGLITYMRTDSPRVAPQAIRETREYIAQKFGRDYVPEKARHFRARSGAQEAHEAIRPTSIFREPQALKPHLHRDQLRLYELIWKRMVASQMAPALSRLTTAEIEARDGKAYLLRATSSRLLFPGFTVLYGEDRDEEQATPRELPPLKKGEPLHFRGVFPEQHFTQPPPRFNEATLIKALEERGIGRPSTYAVILSTLRNRAYVARREGRLYPEKLGMVVADLLIQQFSEVVDLDFTAQMEEKLDQIAEGALSSLSVLREFYGPFAQDLERAQGRCPECNSPLVIKRSQYGVFLACSAYPNCRYIHRFKQDLEQDHAHKRGDEEVTQEKCPKCGSPMVVKHGRYGPFLACSGYPQCKHTQPYVKKLGIPCPDCGGELAQRKSRKGRVFYGCLNYPKCRFATSRRPLGPCPACGGLQVFYRKGWAQCLKCKEKTKLEEKEPVAAGAGSGAGA